MSRAQLKRPSLFLLTQLGLTSLMVYGGAAQALPSSEERISLGLSPSQGVRLEPLTQARDLLRLGDPQGALKGPLSDPKPLTLSRSEERVWGSRGLERLTEALTLARHELRWRAFTQLGDPQAAATEARQLLEATSSPSALHNELKLSVARGLIAQLEPAPSPPSALIEATQALLSDLKGAQRARLQAEAYSLEAQLMERAGDRQGAQLARDTLWRTLGHTPPARGLAPPAQATPQDWLARGEHLFKERAYKPSLEALQEALSKPLPPLMHGNAALLSAVALMRLRVEPARADQLLSLASRLTDEAEQEERTDELRALKASVLRYQSILWARQGRWEHAMEANAALIPLSSGARRDEARYQVGRLLHQAGRYAEATRAHSSLLELGHRDPERVRWFLGWSHYRAGDCPSARAAWASLFSQANLLEGPQALYWSAYCHSKEGDKRLALKVLRRLFKDAPISYYGLLGRQLYAELKGKALSWPHPLKRRRRAHLKLARPRSLSALTRARLWRSKKSQPLWEALALKRSGLDDHARVAWRAACGQPRAALKQRLGSSGPQLCTQAGLYVGDYGSLWSRGARESAGWRISGYGGLKERPSALRVKAYPLAFEGLTRAAAQEEGLTPWWLLGHMLQESRYRPEVVSHAQAIGLMQILERTGLRISERLSWPPPPFSGELLFKPGVALRLSAWYLKQLWLDLGHPVLAMGAYNGGPMRLADHVEAHPELLFTELIEELGAHESRNYMRKVMDHTLRYLALYADEEEWSRWISRLALPTHAPKPKRSVGF